MSKELVNDGNDVILEDRIVDALSFHEYTTDATMLLYSSLNLPTRVIDNKHGPRILSSHGTHKTTSVESEACVYRSSKITTPEVVLGAKLSKNQPCYFDAIADRDSNNSSHRLLLQERNPRTTILI